MRKTLTILTAILFLAPVAIALDDIPLPDDGSFYDGTINREARADNSNGIIAHVTAEIAGATTSVAVAQAQADVNSNRLDTVEVLADANSNGVVTAQASAGSNLAAIAVAQAQADVNSNRLDTVEVLADANSNRLDSTSLEVVLNNGDTATNDMKIVGSLSQGTGHAASGTYTFTGGENCQSYGPSATAIGSGCIASNDYTFAFGENCQSYGAYSAVWGYNCISYGEDVFVGGQENNVTANGIDSIIFGSTIQFDGGESAVFGYQHVLTNVSYSLFAGNGHLAYSGCSGNFASGTQNIFTNSADDGVAIGYRAKVSNANCFVWADGDGTYFGSHGANTFNARATGGFFFDGALNLYETSEPADPADGMCVIWFSNGTGAGNDGDLVLKKTVGGVTSTNTVDLTTL